MRKVLILVLAATALAVGATAWGSGRGQREEGRPFDGDDAGNPVGARAARGRRPVRDGEVRRRACDGRSAPATGRSSRSTSRTWAGTS